MSQRRLKLTVLLRDVPHPPPRRLCSHPPYSPRWLASRGRTAEALQQLCKIRGVPSDDHRIQHEYLDIIVETRLDRAETLERHPNLQSGCTMDLIKLEFYGLGHLFTRRTWQRMSVGMTVVFFQQFIGINGRV